MIFEIHMPHTKKSVFSQMKKIYSLPCFFALKWDLKWKKTSRFSREHLEMKKNSTKYVFYGGISWAGWPPPSGDATRFDVPSSIAARATNRATIFSLCRNLAPQPPKTRCRFGYFIRSARWPSEAGHQSREAGIESALEQSPQLRLGPWWRRESQRERVASSIGR